ncbi:MAG: M23 family metallopeptidase [Endomicrobiia bacterium]
MKKTNFLKTFFSQKITFLLLFHDTKNPIKKSFSLPFLIFIIFLWTLFTAVSVYFSTRHIDYWSAKLKSIILASKYEYLNKEISRTWELLSKVEENDRAIRKLLNMKDKKEIILKSDTLSGEGGPANVQQAEFLQKFVKQPQEIPLVEYSKNFRILYQNLQQQLESYKEVFNYIDYQKKLYRSTPLIWPCYGYIVSPFGKRMHPLYKIEHFHTGIDISNNIGTPVRATADGIVIFVGWQEGYGKVILIEHEFGYTTVYGHLSVFKVKKGQKVLRGEIIGLMGNTGTVTGPHLHYEIWKDGKLQNPIKYVNIEDFFRR